MLTLPWVIFRFDQRVDDKLVMLLVDGRGCVIDTREFFTFCRTCVAHQRFKRTQHCARVVQTPSDGRQAGDRNIKLI